jgi:hypothetical protein
MVVGLRTERGKEYGQMNASLPHGQKRKKNSKKTSGDAATRLDDSLF